MTNDGAEIPKIETKTRSEIESLTLSELIAQADIYIRFYNYKGGTPPNILMSGSIPH